MQFGKKSAVQRRKSRILAFEALEGRALLSGSNSIIVGALDDVNETGGTVGPLGDLGRLVFLDLNRDGTQEPGEPFGFTDIQGHFTFTNLADGTYEVNIQSYPGEHSTNGSSPEQLVTVQSGGSNPKNPGLANYVFQQFSTVLPLTPKANPIVLVKYGNGSNKAANLAATEGSALYTLILGRPAGPTESTAVANAILAGTSTTQIAADLFNSVEYEINTVSSYYKNYLDRVGSPAEVNAWVAVMQQGATEEQVAAAFLGSDEYTAIHSDSSDPSNPSDSPEFVLSLYNNILGRGATSDEVASWISQLNQGTPVSTIVSDFIDSDEHELLAITGDYTDFFARSPDLDDFLGGTSALGGGYGPLTLAQLAADLAGSEEFQNRCSAVV
jgi:hypothetical protein